MITIGKAGVSVRGVVLVDFEISGSLMGCYGMALL